MFLALWTHWHCCSVPLCQQVFLLDEADTSQGSVWEPRGWVTPEWGCQGSMCFQGLHAKGAVGYKRWSPQHDKETPCASRWDNKYITSWANMTLFLTVTDAAISRAACQTCSVFTIQIAFMKAQLLCSSLREMTGFSGVIAMSPVLGNKYGNQGC